MLLTAIAENTFFILLVFSLFAKKASTNKAVFITALVFSIIHLDYFNQLFFATIINRIFMGVIFSYLYVKYNNLYPSIIVHWLSNFIIILFMYTNIP